MDISSSIQKKNGLASAQTMTYRSKMVLIVQYVFQKKDTAYGFDELLAKHTEEIINSYDLQIMGKEIYITEQVNNLLFQK